MAKTIFKNVVHYDTEREAIRDKRKYKKYKSTKTYKWVV